MRHAIELTSGRGPPRLARRARMWRDADRHSRRVRRLRRLLPVVASVIALFLAGATAIPSLLPDIGAAGISISLDGLVMNNPRLSGQLDAHRRYSVTAERAIQSLVHPSRLRLENMSAELDLGADGWIRITCKTARYDTETEVLNLADGIAVTSSDGHRADLTSADVYLREGRFESPDPLRITSPKGTIDAGRINVERDGDVIRMKGGVKMTIQGKESE